MSVDTYLCTSMYMHISSLYLSTSTHIYVYMNIDISYMCKYLHDDLFHSHRCYYIEDVHVYKAMHAFMYVCTYEINMCIHMYNISIYVLYLYMMKKTLLSIIYLILFI
jgi:hypothetical protein